MSHCSTLQGLLKQQVDTVFLQVIVENIRRDDFLNESTPRRTIHGESCLTRLESI